MTTRRMTATRAVTVDSPRTSLPTCCTLCPRRCGVNRAAGERGVCGADDCLVIARAALHAWEEPCISVGAGSGAVFFSGCPLRCRYCQNCDISVGMRGRQISVERLTDIFFELADQGAANLNLVTATQYTQFVIDAVAVARARGLALPVIWNTSGYECAETIRQLEGTVDVYLDDFKYPPAAVSDAAARYSHAPDYFEVARGALDQMLISAGEPRFDDDGRLVGGVVVRHLLLPGRLEDSKRVMRFLWQRYGTRVLYSLMSQYTPVGTFPDMPELDHTVEPGAYEELLDYLDAMGLEDYFWQDGDAAAESFIPPFDETGVLAPPQ